VKRELHALILALVGGTLLKLALTGDFERYVKPGVRPYLVAASIVVLLVAAASLVPRWRSGDDHHGHDHGRFDVAWLLVVPMLVLLVIAPPALGSFSAARSGTALGAAANASDLPALPDGRRVTLSGFVLPGEGGTWYLTRMVITCCAADAQPVKVGLAGTVPDGLKGNDWLQVTGTYATRQDRDPVNAQPIPYLTVDSSTPIPAPALQYES
jgi:uncharacterized membrane protein YcgQ (UPF0703/DUF1980 family)